MREYGLDLPNSEVRWESEASFLDSVEIFTRRAACQGMPLDDVFTSVESWIPDEVLPAPLMKAISLAWADEVVVWSMRSTCVDPLTDLTSVAHLRERIEGLYRRAERDGIRVSETHELLVIETRDTFENELDVALLAVDISHALKTVFVRDEVVAGITGCRFAVLAESQHVTQDSLAVLAVLLRRGAGIPSPLVRQQKLPGRAEELTDFLVTLSS